MQKLVKQRSLLVPQTWSSLGQTDAARAMALAAAWQINRDVYSFADLPTKVLRASEVNVALTQRTFAALPGYAIYVELDELADGGLVTDVPRGFMAGLDYRDGVVDIVFFWVAKSNQLCVDSLSLNGSTIDGIVAQRGVGSCSPERAARLSLMVSAVLMACLNPGQALRLDAETGQGLAADGVTVWRVGDEFSRVVADDYRATKQRLDGAEPCIVAKWSMSDGGDDLMALQCSVRGPWNWVPYGRDHSGLALAGPAI